MRVFSALSSGIGDLVLRVDSPPGRRYNESNMLGARARKGRVMQQSRRWLAVAAAVLLAGWAGRGSASSQDVLEKSVAVPKLISQADLECSFYVMAQVPKVRISGPVQTGEFTLITDGRPFYAEALPGSPAIAEDSLWTILQWGPRVRGTNPSAVLGNIVFRRGRARAVASESGRSMMVVEKSCGVIETGCFLVPFEKGEIVVGEELPYDDAFRKENAPTGRVVFMESETMQVGARGFWALIDIGADQGLRIPDQLIIYRPDGMSKLPRPVANAVVIQTGGRWAVVKILNSRDSVGQGDLAQPRPSE